MNVFVIQIDIVNNCWSCSVRLKYTQDSTNSTNSIFHDSTYGTLCDQFIVVLIVLITHKSTHNDSTIVPFMIVLLVLFVIHPW